MSTETTTTTEATYSAKDALSDLEDFYYYANRSSYLSRRERHLPHTLFKKIEAYLESLIAEEETP